MIYSIGLFILDIRKEQLLLEASNEVVSNHSRTIQLLGILAEAYPKVVSKNELMQKLWRDDDVTDWVLSRQIYQLRQLLSSCDPDTSYIKTVHAKGFKLEIEPRLINSTVSRESVFEQNQHIEPVTDKKNPSIFSKGLIGFSAIAFLLLGCFFGYRELQTSLPIYGEIFPQKIIPLPVSTNWSSSKPDSLQFTTDGILVAPIELDPVYVSASVAGAAFYQGAIFSMKVKLNQQFIDNKGGLRFYYQTTTDGWPGEWDCILDDIEKLDFEYKCQIDEDGTFTKILANEKVNFGVKLHQLQPIGSVVIQSAAVNVPASISTDKGWRTTNNLEMKYERGVAFHPKSLAAKLATAIKGPVNIPGSKIAFTLEVDDSYKNPEVGIQFFLLSKNGGWHDCHMQGENIRSNVFTKICDFKNINNPFVLKKGEQLEIGVSPYGKRIDGKIKIVGITVNE